VRSQNKIGLLFDDKLIIQIYNLLGKQIRELVNDFKKAGYLQRVHELALFYREKNLWFFEKKIIQIFMDREILISHFMLSLVSYL